MTKREMYAVIAEAMADNEEVVAFCKHETELLDRKASYKSNKPSKKSVENESIKAKIIEILSSADSPLTISEIRDTLSEDFSSQKISALLTQLIKAETVVKTYEKKVAYFGLAQSEILQGCESTPCFFKNFLI